MSQRHAVIQIAPAKNGQWFLRLVASNNRTLAHSETYATRSNARRAAQAWITAMEDVLAANLSDTEAIREVQS